MSRPTLPLLALAALLTAGVAGAAPRAGAARSGGRSGAEPRAAGPRAAAPRHVALSGVTLRGRVRKPGVVIDLSREEARFSQGTAHLSARDRRFLAPGERALPAPSRPRR